MSDLDSPTTTTERQFWRTKRPIPHDETRESITRLINSHFKNPAERARISIPANPDRDDDLIAHSYVEQQRDRGVLHDELVAALRDLLASDGRWHDYIDMSKVDRVEAILAKTDAP